MAEFKTANVTHANDQGLQVRMFDGLNDTNDGISSYAKCSYVNLSASALIKTGAGQLYGITVNSHSSGTLVIRDALTATTPLMHNTITLAAGERFIPFYGETFATGLYISIGGTADITVQYR